MDQLMDQQFDDRRYVLNMLGLIRLHNDTFGTNGIEVEVFVLEYLTMRMSCVWTAADLIVLRPRVCELSNHIGQLTRELRADEVQWVLCYKSSLLLLSQDFPETAETLLYSPLMKKVDSIIDSWPTNNVPVANDDELLEIRKMSYRPQLADHAWFNVFDHLKTYKGKQFSEYDWAEQLHEKHEKIAEALMRYADRLSADLAIEANHKNDHFYQIYVVPILTNQPEPSEEKRQRLGISYAKKMDEKLKPAILALTQAYDNTMKAARRLDWARAPLKHETNAESEQIKMLQKFKAAEKLRYQMEDELHFLAGIIVAIEAVY